MKWSHSLTRVIIFCLSFLNIVLSLFKRHPERPLHVYCTRGKTDAHISCDTAIYTVYEGCWEPLRDLSRWPEGLSDPQLLRVCNITKLDKKRQSHFPNANTHLRRILEKKENKAFEPQPYCVQAVFEPHSPVRTNTSLSAENPKQSLLTHLDLVHEHPSHLEHASELWHNKDDTSNPNRCNREHFTQQYLTLWNALKEPGHFIQDL